MGSTIEIRNFEFLHADLEASQRYLNRYEEENGNDDLKPLIQAKQETLASIRNDIMEKHSTKINDAYFDKNGYKRINKENRDSIQERLKKYDKDLRKDVRQKAKQDYDALKKQFFQTKQEINSAKTLVAQKKQEKGLKSLNPSLDEHTKNISKLEKSLRQYEQEMFHVEWHEERKRSWHAHEIQLTRLKSGLSNIQQNAVNIKSSLSSTKKEDNIKIVESLSSNKTKEIEILLEEERVPSINNEEIEQTKESTIIEPVNKKLKIDEFKEKIKYIERSKSSSDIKEHSESLPNALDDILQNSEMTVAEYTALRDTILSTRELPNDIAMSLNDKLYHYEKSMPIKPRTSLIDQQETEMLGSKIGLQKGVHRIPRPNFIEYKTKEQLLHSLSTTYLSFAKGAAGYKLADTIFTEARRIDKEEGNRDLAFDIVYDFLKSCKYAEKTVRDKGLTGDARNKEVFKQLTARFSQQKAGTARMNDSDPNDSNSEELSEKEFVRKPTKGVYTKIGGLGWMTSKAGRNIDKTVKNLKGRLYPEQKQLSILGALFGWIPFGSNKTGNTEEQNSNHIQKELGSLHWTLD
ncbi:MAG: hypothetical protein GY821_02875 [Gammaproteobacteria bacterium]|nr:hypothetical protein [Gammaproteobacteria bacterium]